MYSFLVSASATIVTNEEKVIGLSVSPSFRRVADSSLQRCSVSTTSCSQRESSSAKTRRE